MIRINLLPPEFRVVKKNVDHGKYYKYAVIGGGIFTLITLTLFVDFLFSLSQYSKLDRAWKKMLPQFQELTDLRSEVEGDVKKEKNFIQQFITTPRPLTHLMMWCSELLPEASWLTELELKNNQDAGSLMIKGLAFQAEDGSDIANIESFLQKYKTKLPDARLSLKTTRQQSKQASLTQFIAHFAWGDTEKDKKSKKTVKKASGKKGKK